MISENTTNTNLSNLQLLELIAALLTGIGKIVFINLIDLRLPFIIATCLFWLGYVIYRAGQDRSIMDRWGLNGKDFKTTFFELLPYAIFLVIIFYFIGMYTGKNVINWRILPILALYPLWGILQQFLVLNLFGGNLKSIAGNSLKDAWIILITALLFSVIHYPSPILIFVTFPLALVYMIL